MPKVQLPSTPRGRKLMTRLADLLMKNSRNKKGLFFNYGDWGSVEDGKKPGMNCGTSACALGLAAISGKFPGLGYAIDRSSNNITLDTNLRKPGEYLTNPEIGALYFDLTDEESCHIFGGGIETEDSIGAKAERAVAKAIRKFVKGKYKPLMSVSGPVSD